ncbi:tryptophan--tRNA ligase [Ammonifex thiophilus]|uniref:Tryptophan--tRNA ligase n=1 Tax=Ammonifex thiophilus TaxID=444093 RepID=A0A3D8P494_9THEO|nr:tryptophan--tRNA ligase [Ammonifex thiophilus]RDV83949.1 tryptophan--tRNA ligase [Ammonifex thiophilus]
MRILSGMRPTGYLHLGHLCVLENWLELQKEHECFFFVADWHALTTEYENPRSIKEYTYAMVADWLAVGLDPEKSVIFVQSHVPAHAELHLIFSMFTPLSWLERVPTYKDQVRKLKALGKDITTYGFLGYPLLQAADILIYLAEGVPVGEDQLPHIELCREIARRFNYLYAPIFPEPQGILAEVKLVPGIDGQKMSKSYRNVIPLTASAEELANLVNRMVTDPARIHKHDPGHPEVCTVFQYHRIYQPERARDIETACRRGEIGCVACKKELAMVLDRRLAPIREKRAEIMARPDYLREVLEEGKGKARAVANATLARVREALNL